MVANNAKVFTGRLTSAKAKHNSQSHGKSSFIIFSCISALLIDLVLRNLILIKRPQMKEAAEALKRRKEDVIALWEETVKKEIPVARKTERLILLNILPHLLDDIVQILQRVQNEIDLQNCPDFEQIVKKSMDHGRHRASTSHFNSQNIVKEHMVLHKVLIMILKSENAYDQESGVLLSLALETSMAYSVDSFDASLQEMREKLTATLAHDIRNPLAAANLGLNTLQEQDGTEHILKVSGMAGRNVRKAIDLVEDLLDAISVRSGEGISLTFTERNIVDDVKLVVDEVNMAFANCVELQLSSTEIRGVFAATAVRRILENLITNAVKYGAPEKPIGIGLSEEGENVVLKVHNYGNSISSEDQKEIFRFMKHSDNDSKTNLKSWGIGLAFVKMAAEAHGGFVEVESNKKDGTTFSVFLKKHAEKPGKRRTKLNVV